MEINAATAAELIAAIHAANAAPDDTHIIHLIGQDKDFYVSQPEAELFGSNAFPIIESSITIEGNGRTISRAADAPLFRFFGIDAKSGHPNASLTLKRLYLINGDSGTSGGGAIANDGELVLERCNLRHNQGTLGGALYNGDDKTATLIKSEFTLNRATEKAGAIFNSRGSKLVIRDCQFSDNQSPQDGASVWVMEPRGLEFQATRIMDGLFIERLFHVDLEITHSPKPINRWPFDTRIRVDDEAMQIISAWDEPPLKWDSSQVGSAWLKTYKIPAGVKAVLNSLNRIGVHDIQALLASLRENEAYDILLHLGLAMHSQELQADPIYAPTAAYYFQILMLLVTDPNPDSLETALRLYDTLEPPLRHQIAIFTTQLIKPDSASELFFEKYGTEAFQRQHPGRSYDDLLSALAQELVLRGINVDAIPPIHAFLNRTRHNDPTSDLAWIPSHRLEIEDQIRRDNPTMTANANSDFPYLSRFMDFSGWTIPIPAQLPAYKEIFVVAERELIRTALEQVYNLEARVFHFEAPLNPNTITPNWLTALPLACLEASERMILKSTTPNDAFRELFVIACTGGPYMTAYGPGVARVKAWQSLAGLVGASQKESVEHIEATAKHCHWFAFRAVNKWFINEWIDIGIAVLRADNQTLAVLAATATD